MFRTTRPAATDVGAALRELPPSHVTYQHDAGWLVLGPTGVFVVADGDGDGDLDLDGAARRADAAAQRLRRDLAAELAWVPFVDAVVVSDRASEPITLALPCLTVPRDLLASTIADGPRTVDEATLAQICRLHLAATPAHP